MDQGALPGSGFSERVGDQMSRLDKVAEAFQLLGEALPGDPMLARWEERAVRAASQIERESRDVDVRSPNAENLLNYSHRQTARAGRW